MTTTFKPIKALFLAVFLALALVSPVRAQTEPATTAQVEEMKSALITLLTQLIAQLQEQITELIAQQSATTQAVTNIQATLTPAPVLGVAAPIFTPKLISVNAGNNGSFTGYLFNKKAKNEGRSYDINNLEKSEISVTANTPINGPLTELFVNGVRQNITISNISTNGNSSKFEITPNIYSFASNEGDNYHASIQLRFVTGTGDNLLTLTKECEAVPYEQTYAYWSTACRDGSFPLN